MCDAVTPVSVAPSPKSHEYVVTVPSESDEADPSTATASGVGVAVNAAVGGWLAGTSGTITCCAVLAVPPASSVTVRVTV